MGRPAWATDAQWTWLKAQAAAYALIKGTNATTDFWPTYLKEWVAKWPIPALEELVKEPSANNGGFAGTDGADDEPASNAGSGGDDNENDDLALDAGASADADAANASPNAANGAEALAIKKRKTSKKPLTMEIVSSLAELASTEKTEITY